MARLPISRTTIDTLPVYACLNRGSLAFRKTDFNLHLPAREDHEKVDCVRMSGIGYCARLQWYKLHEPEEIPEDDPGVEHTSISSRILALGDILEEVTIEILRRGGWEVSDQQLELKDPDLNVKGHIDGTIKIRDEVYLFEHKALNREGVLNLITDGMAVAYPVYYDQAQYYMYCLNLKKCCWIAYTKDTSQYYVEIVDYNETYVQDFLRKKALIIQTVPNPKIIPEQFVTRDCDWCPLKFKCRDELDGRETFKELYDKKKNDPKPAILR